MKDPKSSFVQCGYLLYWCLWNGLHNLFSVRCLLIQVGACIRVHWKYLQIWCLWRKPFHIVVLIYQCHEITSNNCRCCGSTWRGLKSQITEFVYKIYVCVTKFWRNNCFKTLFQVKAIELSNRWNDFNTHLVKVHSENLPLVLKITLIRISKTLETRIKKMDHFSHFKSHFLETKSKKSAKFGESEMKRKEGRQDIS